MRFIKNALCLQQVFQFGRAHTLGFPVYVFDAASPLLVFKQRPALLDKRPVKSRIVGNDDRHVFEQRFDFIIIYAFAPDHLVGDVVNGNGFSGYGAARVFELVKNGGVAVYGSGFRVKFKEHHAEFNQLVGVNAQTCGFGVKHNAFLQSATGSGRFKLLSRYQATQHFVSGVLLQLPRQFCGLTV